MNTPSRRVPRWIWIAIAALLLMGVPASLAATSSSAACAACHSAQAEALHDTSHATLSCYSCHLDNGVWSWPAHKGAELFRMYPSTLLGSDLDGAGSRIARRACTACHGSGPDGVTESRGLSIVHDRCAREPAPCAQCHSASAHPDAVRWTRTPIMDDCIACHAESSAPLECDSCHSGEIEGATNPPSPWQVTHGVDRLSAHGLGDLTTCESCHDRETCGECHVLPVPHSPGFHAQHGADALRGETTGELCIGCHRSEGWCVGCHEVEMPHPEDFLPNHPLQVDTASGAPCLRCHAQRDCITCHRAHSHPSSTEGTLEGELPSPPEVGLR